MSRKMSLRNRKEPSTTLSASPPQLVKPFDIFLKRKKKSSNRPCKKPLASPLICLDANSPDDEVKQPLICLDEDSPAKEDELPRICRNTNSPVKEVELPLAWNEKYAPRQISEIVGHHQVACDLRDWLVNWQRRRKASSHAGKNGGDSDEESDPNTCVVLYGEPGIGKTSLVHAVAKECKTQVFEVNCSSKRSGRIITETLLEATQSHHVGRVSGGESSAQVPSNTLFSFLSKKSKQSPTFGMKASNSKSTPNEERTRISNFQENSLHVSSNSLILFDDADLIFEEDEAFWRAVTNLIVESKKPVVFTVTQFIGQTLKHLNEHLLLEMKSPNDSMIVEHLKNICVKEALEFNSYNFNQLVGRYPGDIRRCMAQAQFDLLFRSGREERTTESTNSQDEGGNVNDASDSEFASESFYDSLILQEELRTVFNFVDDTERRKRHMLAQPLPYEDFTFSMGFAKDIGQSIACLAEVNSSTPLAYKSELQRIEHDAISTLKKQIAMKLMQENHISNKTSELSTDYFPYLSIITAAEANRSHSVAGHSRKSRRFLHYLDTVNLFIEPNEKLRLSNFYDKFLP